MNTKFNEMEILQLFLNGPGKFDSDLKAGLFSFEKLVNGLVFQLNIKTRLNRVIFLIKYKGNTIASTIIENISEIEVVKGTIKFLSPEREVGCINLDDYSLFFC